MLASIARSLAASSARHRMVPLNDTSLRHQSAARHLNMVSSTSPDRDVSVTWSVTVVCPFLDIIIRAVTLPPASLGWTYLPHFSTGIVVLRHGTIMKYL